MATTSGSVYDRWMKRCFTNTEVVVVESVTDAVLAFNQGRADAVMFDDTVARARGGRRPSCEADGRHRSSRGRTASASSRGTPQLKRWVDSRLDLMRKKDIFQQILKNNVAPRFVPAFSKNILRPNNTFGYAPPGSPSADTVCP